jgi:hypothetical protein
MAGKPASIRNMRTLPAMNPEKPAAAVDDGATAPLAETPTVEMPDDDPWAAAESITETSTAPAAAPLAVAPAPVSEAAAPARIPDYVAELEDQRKRNRELTDLVLELNEKIDRLSAVASQSKVSKSVEIDDREIQLSDKEKEIYGDSLPVIEKIVKRHLKEFKSNLDAKLDDITATTNKNDLASFVNAVQLKVANARTLTRDPGFIRYLSERVPGTGLTRKQIFDLAHENRDLEAVVSIFEGYSADTPDAAASMRAPSTIAANPQVTAPTRPTQGRKPVFKESDSRKLSEDFRTGKIDIATYKKRRSMLEEAVREGRIIRGK